MMHLLMSMAVEAEMIACGHPECKISSAMDDSLTFGRGELDDYGYWEIPCPICARAWEKEHPEDGPCWPYTKEVREEYKKLFEVSDPYQKMFG